MVLGALLAFALSRYEFFGRQTLSLLVILPIALPGIVTALALRTAFREILGIDLSIWTIVVAHATFCIVVVYNNVIARLRRLGTSLEEASRDLGADGFTTFRLVTFPMLRGAFFAGGHARVRAVVRRDRGDPVHRTRRGHHAADLDLPEPVPPQPGADRQRRGGRAGPGLDHPDLAVPAALGRLAADGRM